MESEWEAASLKGEEGVFSYEDEVPKMSVEHPRKATSDEGELKPILGICRMAARRCFERLSSRKERPTFN